MKKIMFPLFTFCCLLILSSFKSDNSSTPATVANLTKGISSWPLISTPKKVVKIEMTYPLGNCGGGQCLDACGNSLTLTMNVYCCLSDEDIINEFEMTAAEHMGPNGCYFA